MYMKMWLIPTDKIFQELKNEVLYLSSETYKIHMEGKIYPISRQIAAYGGGAKIYT